MAFEQSYGAVAAPGLIFPYVNKSIETGIMQEAKDAEGGFALWGKNAAGEKGKVYVTKPNSNAVLLGIAQRTMVRDSYAVGDVVNVIKAGRVWVRVLGEVVAGDKAYVNDTNNGITATATGGTPIVGGVFKSDAADGKLAELEILGGTLNITQAADADADADNAG